LITAERKRSEEIFDDIVKPSVYKNSEFLQTDGFIISFVIF